MTEKIEKGWRRWKKKKQQTNGILALSRMIREGYKRLPLISLDRSKPRPFQFTAKTQKRPKHIYMCIHQIHTHIFTPFVTQNVHNTSRRNKEHLFELSKQLHVNSAYKMGCVELKRSMKTTPTCLHRVRLQGG